MESFKFVNSKGKDVACVLHRGEERSKELIVVVHGFMTNMKGGEELLCNLLQSQGHHALRLDLDSLGETKTPFKDATIEDRVENLFTVVQNMRRLYGYTRINFVGNCYGGFVVLRALIKYQDEWNTTKVCLRGPLLDAKGFYALHFSPEEILAMEENGRWNFTLPFQNKQIKGILYDTLLFDPTGIDCLRQVKSTVLLMHGTADTFVSIEPARECHFLSHVTMVEIRKGDHTLGVNGDFTKANKLMIDFFKKD